MPRRIAAPPPLLVHIAPDGPEPLQQQIYRALRDAILDGRLRPGARLPSTRALAEELGVSRNTVVPAFEQLRAEGFLHGASGAGTRVAAELPDEFLRVHRAPAAAAPAASAVLPRPARRSGGSAVPFRLSVPARDEFPFGIWGKLIGRCWRQSGRELIGPPDVFGYEPLRRAVAEYVGAARGVRCTGEDLVITAGAGAAIAIATRLVLRREDQVWVEEPGYVPIRSAVVAAGARPVPVPVRADGIDVAQGILLAPRARLACVTPSNQHPLGGAMSLQSRIALLEWARREEAWILEDDYDSEFRYAGRPLPSLQGLDRAGRVMYAGTFTTTLFPSLRLGFLVVPPRLADGLAALRAVTDRGPPSLEQAVLADFIRDGHLARHIRRMRALYAERLADFCALADAELRGLLHVEPVDAGMRLIGRLPDRVSDIAVRDEAARLGVMVDSLSRHYIDQKSAQQGLVLGFAGYDRASARAGLRKLGDAIRAAMSAGQAGGSGRSGSSAEPRNGVRSSRSKTHFDSGRSVPGNPAIGSPS